MKKVVNAAVCIILVTVFVFSLCGCNASEALVGTWTGEADYAQLFNYINYTDETDKQYFSLRHLKVTQIITFNKNGTYSVEIDETSKEEAIDSALVQTREGLINFYVKTLAEAGITIGVESYLATAGTTIDGLVEEMDIETAVRELFDTLEYQGNYMAKKGKLYCSDSLEHTYDLNIYETYRLVAGKLTLTGAVYENEDSAAEAEEVSKSMYPIEYTKK